MANIGKDNFKVREDNDTRIESLSDGVFGLAIAITLLTSSSPSNYTELLDFVYDIIPFGFSVIFIFWVWREQKNYFRRFGLHDRKSTNLNLFLLFFVLFFSYPLKFLMTWIFTFFPILLSGRIREKYDYVDSIIPFTQISWVMVIYGLGFVLVFGCIYLMHKHAYAKRKEIGLNEIEEIETAHLVQTFLTNTLIGLASILIATISGLSDFFFGSFFAGIIYNLTWIIGIFNHKKKEKRLAEIQNS